MIYIYRDGHQYGPYTPGDIEQFMQTGYAAENDYARTEQMPNWVRLRDLLQHAEEPPPNAAAVSAALSDAPGHSALATPSDSSLAPRHEIHLPATVAPEASLRPAHGVPLAIEARPFHPSNAITWPFHEREWIASLWIPMLWEFPVFGFLLAWGWSLDVIRRRATRRASVLPPSSEMGTMLKNGFVVSIAGAIYFLVIPFCLGTLIQGRLFYVLWESYRTGGWWEVVSNPMHAFRLSAEQSLLQSLLTVVFPLCLFVGFPLFLAALVRFGITGKLRSFFNIFGNLFLLIRFLGDFLLFGFFVAVTLTALGSIPAVIAALSLYSLFLALPGLVADLLLSIVPVTAAIWITAYLAGSLSQRICDKGALKAA